MSNDDLKHLNFVKTYSAAGVDAVANSKTFAKVCSIYDNTKEKSDTLKSGMEVIEGLAKTYAQPVVDKALHLAPTVLAMADSKVDASLAYAHTMYEEKVLPSTPVQSALALKNALAERQAANMAAFVQVCLHKRKGEQ